ncbi:MAG: hypothetical protein J3R72DRAFT_477263 [Linnemannia gamsii]|nr:MAG: hypothetical protein J3R72DRAFT_477263 [Linnemannia gamsii]
MAMVSRVLLVVPVVLVVLVVSVSMLPMVVLVVLVLVLWLPMLTVVTMAMLLASAVSLMVPMVSSVVLNTLFISPIRRILAMMPMTMPMSLSVTTAKDFLSSSTHHYSTFRQRLIQVGRLIPHSSTIRVLISDTIVFQKMKVVAVVSAIVDAIDPLARDGIVGGGRLDE